MIFGQRDSAVRFGWGPREAAELVSADGCLVVVDVLSFTTAVTIAVERGSAVYPYRWRDDSAAAYAARIDAVLAVGRAAVTETHPWSLSPAALEAAPVTARLVLPSPNGSTIAAAAVESGATVVAGSLRNASAVGAYLRRSGYGTPARPVVVVASGERWSDESLRPCLEDQLGAGAILDALGAPRERLSPEAAACLAGYRPVAADVSDLVTACGGGRELVERGFDGDVAAAIAVDRSNVVPVLRAGAFVDAAD
ncbi:2-phosphosulfolactate phosphatase [Stackebrandtia soli]|uniref:2-phosphosulfolactate phosphatase n=1 Tax=Stackebrandtia soli TaxID=1892856 RepID=UPI0039EB8322